MKTTLFAALVAVLLAGPAMAANTWQVLDSSQCTGLGAATGIGAGRFDCCRGTAASGANTCDIKFSFGTWWGRFVSLGTAGSAQTYTTGGDALNAAALGKLGLSNIMWGECGVANAPGNTSYLVDIVPVAGGGAKVQAWEVGAAVDGPFKEVTSAQAMINLGVTCWIYGT